MSDTQFRQPVDRPSWAYVCEHFGLDESFNFSEQEREQYFLLLEAGDVEPQHLTFMQFQKYATVVPLQGHGRVAEVKFAGCRKATVRRLASRRSTP